MAAYASKTLPLATQTRSAKGHAAGAAKTPPAGYIIGIARREKDEPVG